MRDRDQRLLWEKYNQVSEGMGQPDDFTGAEPSHLPNADAGLDELEQLLRDVENSDGYSDDDEVEGQSIIDDTPDPNSMQQGLIELERTWDKSSPAYPLLQQLIQYTQPPSATDAANIDRWAAEESPRERSRQEMGWGQSPSRFGPTGDDARDYD